MSRTFTKQIFPNTVKYPIVATGTIDAVPAGNVSVYADFDELYREVEIINGWRWLFNGIRDRNLLERTRNEAPGIGAIYSACPIDSLVEPSRETDWGGAGLVLIVPGTIAISVGIDVAANVPFVVIENSIIQLMDSVRETHFAL